MDAPSLARLVRFHRLALGFTQEELAERARLSAREISDLERGLKRAPRASTFRLLAEALQLSADDAGALLALGQGGRSDPADVADGPTPPHNLPRRLSSFVGRAHELVEVQQLVERTPLVTLIGPGGVGKTQLALEVAARCVERASDGLWFVEFASLTDPALVPLRLAEILGISERGREALQTRLLTAIGRRQLLLVLDNCEHLIDACAELVEALLQACPRTRVLATSRQPLGISGEHVWPVAPLSLADDASGAPSDAVQLFVERAVAVSPSFAMTDDNRRSIVQVCAHLDGIPLAIELAAARVKTLSPAQIDTRLGDRFRLLVGGSRTAHARQQTLRATLAWSYDLLSPPDQHLFADLAVFSGGWDLEAAELVCADEATDMPGVLDGLDRLVDRSLVLAQRGRYWLLETVREYAHEQLRQSAALGQLRERHAMYFLQLAEDAEPELKRVDQAAWFERLSRDHENFRSVLTWSRAEGRLDIALRLAIALQRFWEVRGHWSEARRWLTELLDTPGAATQPPSLRAAALAHAGLFAYVLGDFGAGRRLSTEGLHLARQVDAPAIAAFALHTLGEILMNEDDFAAARPVLHESLALARQLEDGWATARVLSNLSAVAEKQVDIDLARSHVREAISIARQAGERRIESTLLLHMARLCADDLAAALTYLDDALAIKQELGDRSGAGSALHCLGWNAFDRGDYTAAYQHFRKALAIARDLGVADRPSAYRPSTLAGLASVALQLGDAKLALRLFAADARIAESGGLQYASYLSERRRPLLDAARQQLGIAATEPPWSESWALAPEELEAAVCALAAAAEHGGQGSAERAQLRRY